MKQTDHNRIDTTKLDFAVDRRRLLQMFGAAGLSVTGLRMLNAGALAQDATPPPMAMPSVGLQTDGTTLWKVLVGGGNMEQGVEFHAFFPGEITINAGDSIWFAEEMPMFHTVTFPVPGEMPPPIIMPDPEVPPPADGTPAAGPPKLIINPIMFTGAGNWVVDGTQLVSSAGDVFADPTVPWIFSFPTAGAYDYVCVPHSSVMQAKVIVQDAGAAYPMDQAGVDAAGAEQMMALQAQAFAEILKYSVPVSTPKDDGSNLWQVAAGAGGTSQVRVQRFLPVPIEVTVGDSIMFTNQSEGEPHTVTFIEAGMAPPEDTMEAFADGTPKLVQSMEVFLPQGGNTWSGTGYLNSGFTGMPQLGLPFDFEVLFDTPGDFIVYCALHGSPDGTGMAAPVTVKAAG